MRVTVTRRDRPDRDPARRRAARARRRGHRALARPGPGARARSGVEAAAWDPLGEPAPGRRARRPRRASSTSPASTSPSAGRRAPRSAIRDSREIGTRNLVAGLRAAEPRPRVLVSASAVGYYGPHGDERVAEDTPPGDDFLAEVCVAWEREAAGRRASSGCASRRPHRRRARPRRRRAGEDAAALPARRRRPGRRRAPVHAVDPRRRPRRPLPRRARRRRWTGPVNAHARPSR